MCIFCKDGAGKDMWKAGSEPDKGLDNKVEDSAMVVGKAHLLSKLGRIW